MDARVRFEREFHVWHCAEISDFRRSRRKAQLGDLRVPMSEVSGYACDVTANGAGEIANEQSLEF